LNFKTFLKYKQAVVIILAYYFLFLSLTVYFNLSETYADPTNLTPLIPIKNIYLEAAVIFLCIAPFSALIGGLLGGYFLTPVFLFIHKKILGSNLLYGIQERPRPQTFKKMSRGYYPALFSVNVNSIILFSVPWFLDFLLSNELLEMGGPTYSTLYVPGFLALVIFTIGLGTLFFSPIWFLTDAGIVYSNQVRVSGTDEPVEGRTVGGRFTDFLRGFVGLGVVFSYLQFLLVFISEQIIPSNPMDIIVFALFFFGLPIFLIIAVLPSLIILNVMKERRIRFVRDVANGMGITDFVQISFEKVDS
jgi:hypothetical protein